MISKLPLTTDAAPSAPYLSQAIEVGNLVFVSGQVHNTANGKLIDSSVEEKLAQVMRNIEAILQAGNLSLDDIVKVTIYLTDIATLPELNKAYPAYFSEPRPAREAICVQALPLGASIEISVIAAK